MRYMTDILFARMTDAADRGDGDAVRFLQLYNDNIFDLMTGEELQELVEEEEARDKAAQNFRNKMLASAAEGPAFDDPGDHTEPDIMSSMPDMSGTDIDEIIRSNDFISGESRAILDSIFGDDDDDEPETDIRAAREARRSARPAEQEQTPAEPEDDEPTIEEYMEAAQEERDCGYTAAELINEMNMILRFGEEYDPEIIMFAYWIGKDNGEVTEESMQETLKEMFAD